MTQKLIKKLIAQNYKYIARSNDREFCATKAEIPFKDEDNQQLNSSRLNWDSAPK